MNDADLDIILSIADGQLTGEAKQEALARIAADPELGEELASQLSAVDSLKSLDPARMTPTERSALRNALVDQLNLQTAPAVVATAKARRSWWQPVLGLAAAAALLVAVVAVPSMLSSQDDSSAEVVAIAPVTTTAAASAESSAGDAATRDADASTSSSTVQVPLVAPEDVQEFFAAPPPPDDISVTTLAGDQATMDTQDAADEAIPETTVASVELLAAGEPIAIDSTAIDACLTHLADDLPEGEHIPWAATIEDGVTVIHLGVEAEDGVQFSVSIDLDTCVITSQSP